VEGPGLDTIEFLEELGYRVHGYHDGQLVPDRFGVVNTFFLA
jgi:hypothetical protein